MEWANRQLANCIRGQRSLKQLTTSIETWRWKSIIESINGSSYCQRPYALPQRVDVTFSDLQLTKRVVKPEAAWSPRSVEIAHLVSWLDLWLSEFLGNDVACTSYLDTLSRLIFRNAFGPSRFYISRYHMPSSIIASAISLLKIYDTTITPICKRTSIILFNTHRECVSSFLPA